MDWINFSITVRMTREGFKLAAFDGAPSGEPIASETQAWPEPSRVVAAARSGNSILELGSYAAEWLLKGGIRKALVDAIADLESNPGADLCIRLCFDEKSFRELWLPYYSPLNWEAMFIREWAGK
jgi:hypothetical protein